MTNPIKVAVLTGKRGGFGAMKPLLRLLRDSEKTQLQLVVTDQHLNPEFGKTLLEIEQEFETAAAVDMAQEGGSARERSEALGRCLEGMGAALTRLNPDVLVLYGDRGEVLATAIAAVHLGIPIAHLQGGDISGNVDETIRHALTKLSHLHFASCQASADRIVALGEEPWRVQIVGDNHVDLIVAGEYSGAAEIRERYGIPKDEEPILLLLHPETVRARDHYADAVAVLDTVLECERRTVIVYPCSDQGYDSIVRAIEERRGQENVSVHNNIPAADFWGLMAISDAMVGNSSAALIEAPYFGLPTVNVGERQKGRMRAENVVDSGYEPEALKTALACALDEGQFFASARECSRPYGEGQAGRLVYERLCEVDYSDRRLLDKRMTY